MQANKPVKGRDRFGAGAYKADWHYSVTASRLPGMVLFILSIELDDIARRQH